MLHFVSWRAMVRTLGIASGDVVYLPGSRNLLWEKFSWRINRRGEFVLVPVPSGLRVSPVVPDQVAHLLFSDLEVPSFNCIEDISCSVDVGILQPAVVGPQVVLPRLRWKLGVLSPLAHLSRNAQRVSLKRSGDVSVVSACEVPNTKRARA